ncbi:MAG TPA: ABC transporter ATP-binding protein [Candidatus Dormibacteraeota bacterium]|nr:ABC transporter ATP-binding protein [Candidatus Dormibacteraeota bacterium]
MLTRLLARHLRPYRRQVALVIVLIVVQSIANLYLPNLNADIINNGVVRGDIAYIWRTGGLMLAVAVGLSIVAVVAAYFSALVAMSTGRDLRKAIFSQVQRFSAVEMNRFGAPSLITRNTNDVQQVQIFLAFGLVILVSAPITAVGGVIMALYENRTLSALLLVIIPFMALVIGVLLLLAVPLFRSMQVRIDRINQVLREQITGVRVVRAFVRMEHERTRFARANVDLTATALRVNRIFTVAMPAMLGIFNLSSVAVLWFGGHLIASGSMPIGNLTAFLTYLMQILMAVMMATMMTILIPRASACADRIGEVLATASVIVDPARPVTVAAPTGTVEFRGVTFHYPGAERPVLRDVSFCLRPGVTTAIIGSTGSGKTTIVKLITRFFDATGGAVVVDGVDVRERSLESLWDGIGLVPQQAYLFGGTVASNLRLGRPEATDDDLWRSLRVAQAADFVSEMPNGLSEPMAQGGTSVSGGQRQRLAIARALVKRPRIYLFDDCFSALDAATDARLRAALTSETRDATVVIVSQRVSTIRQADQIIVMEEGAVVGTGTHAELLTGCPTYQEIVDSQLRGEESVA